MCVCDIQTLHQCYVLLKQLDIRHTRNHIDTLSVCNSRNQKVIFLLTSKCASEKSTYEFLTLFHSDRLSVCRKYPYVHIQCSERVSQLAVKSEVLSDSIITNNAPSFNK